jgi:LPXTG-motif cell wall-anchored protein
MTRSVRWASVFVTSFVLLVGVAGPAMAASVGIVDNAFGPKVVTIKVGESVTWSSSGANPHTVTADGGAFDSSPSCPTPLTACLHNGDSYTHTFSSIGTFPYHCKIHGASGGIGMAGVVVVTAANGSPPPGGLPNTGAGPGLQVTFGLGVLLLLLGAAVLFRSRRSA